MKKALLTLAAVAMTASVYAADGTIQFTNFGIPNSAGTGSYDAPILRANGTGAGVGYSVGLFKTDGTLVTSTTFFGDTGFFIGDEVPVPGQAPGSTPTLTVRAWDTTAGSFANAVTQNKQHGELSFTSQPLGGQNPAPPPPAFFAPGLTGFGNQTTGTGFTMVVPEPSTYALGVLGLGAVAMMRRRKS